MGAQTEPRSKVVYHKILKVMEEGKARIAKQVGRIILLASKGLSTQHPVKIVGILVLGALLTAGTAVLFAGESDEPVIHPSAETVKAAPKFSGEDAVNIVSLKESSGESLRIQEKLRQADRREDYQEMVLYWNRPQQNTKVEATVMPNYPDNFKFVPLKESSGETLRIREKLRQADRREDYQEMVRYWNRPK